MTQPRTWMRADARRNHDRILAEAHTVLAVQGIEASLEDIARRAGVGIGTLYRHFPTRQVLLEALLHQRFARLEAEARRLGATEPGPALATWLRTLLEHATTYRGLAATLMATLGDETSALYVACQTAQDSGARLLERAQRAGVVRADVSAVELFLLVGGIAAATEQCGGPERGERLLALTLEGLWSR